MIDALMLTFTRLVNTHEFWSTLSLVTIIAMCIGALVSNGRLRLFSLLFTMSAIYAALVLVYYEYLYARGHQNNAAGIVVVVLAVLFFVGTGFVIGYTIAYFAKRASKHSFNGELE